MADDERRAEIEAAAAAIRHVIDTYCPAWDRRIDWTRPDYAEQSRVDAQFILDRVRDARDDDEAARSRSHTQECEDAAFIHHAATGGDMECICNRAARSPQAEDHEAEIEAAAKALWDFDEEPQSEGIHGPRWEQANEWEREDYRNRVRVVISRVSPSRDGSVAEIERLRDRNAALERALGLAADEDLGSSRDSSVAVEDAMRVACLFASGRQNRSCAECLHLDWSVCEVCKRMMAEFSPASTGDREENDRDRH